ncbi:MAG TPA: CopD family protein [Longimicrobium sp.]|nr:CopD family protein [Longimicrobium sp.]
MREIYLLNVTVHVLAAMLWLGGMFSLALVGAPVLREVDPPPLRAMLFTRIGRRLRGVGWGAIAVLVATGIGNLAFAGAFRGGRIASADVWGSPYGHALALKLAAVATMIAVSAVHDFWLGPLAGRLVPGSPRALQARSRAAWLARINALIGIVIVAAAVRLARGG